MSFIFFFSYALSEYSMLPPSFFLLKADGLLVSNAEPADPVITERALSRKNVLLLPGRPTMPSYLEEITLRFGRFVLAECSDFTDASLIMLEMVVEVVWHGS
jgi:hypothetical protein